MQLLEIAVLAPVAPGVTRRLCGDGALGRQIGQQLVGEVDKVLVLDISGCREHHPLRAVMVSQIGDHGVAAQSADDFRSSEYGPPHRLLGISTFLKVIEDDVVRRVVGLADLLQDHCALTLELLWIEGGVLQDVREDIESERHIFLQYLRVISGALAGGVGVEVTANRLDLFGDIAGAAPFGALEGHVLEKMRGAVDGRRFVPCADIDPDAERYRVDGLDSVGGDPQPVRQSRNPGAHAAAPARRA